MVKIGCEYFMVETIIKPEILVLMSTYNGEKYLEEQLESIKNQEGVNVHCLIRDDGSTDKTIQILSEYCSRHPEFQFYSGKNIGVVESFNELINNDIVTNYDWVSFCDQDDVWLKKKLIIAIEVLKKEPNNMLPLLYCSNLTTVDKNLQKIGMKWNENPKFNKSTALVQNIATGCTEVFNRPAVYLYRKGIGLHMEFHDYWMFLVCIYMGKVIYDPNSQIFYRQHNANVVGAKEKKFYSAFRHLVEQRGRGGNRQIALKDFLECYSSSLSNVEISMISHLVNYKRSIVSRMFLVLSPKYKGSLWKVTIGFKVRALTGTIY